jgi:hypothetical protein
MYPFGCDDRYEERLRLTYCEECGKKLEACECEQDPCHDLNSAQKTNDESSDV